MTIELIESNFVSEPFPAQITDYRVSWNYPGYKDPPLVLEVTLRITQNLDAGKVKFEVINLSNECGINIFEEGLDCLVMKMERCVELLYARGRPAIGLRHYPHAKS